MKPRTRTNDLLASFEKESSNLSTDNLELCQTAVTKSIIWNQGGSQLKQVQETVKNTMKDSVKTEISSWSDIVRALTQRLLLYQAFRELSDLPLKKMWAATISSFMELKMNLACLRMRTIRNSRVKWLMRSRLFPRAQTLTASRIGYQKAGDAWKSPTDRSHDSCDPWSC